MTLGQVASLAAGIAIERGIPVQEVPAEEIREAIASDPLQDGSVPDIFIDDSALEVPDGWARIKSKRGYGPSYLETGAPGATMVFTTTVPHPGRYAVYSYLNLVDDVEPVTTYRIGDREVTVNAREVPLDGQMKGDWAPLGEFEIGDSVTVTLTGGASGKPLRADCILLVRRDG